MKPRRGTPPPPPAFDEEQQQQEEAIPRLESTSAAIFVPLVAEPGCAAPPSRSAYLQASLAQLDAHAAHVDANIRALARRECLRLQRQLDDDDDDDGHGNSGDDSNCRSDGNNHGGSGGNNHDRSGGNNHGGSGGNNYRGGGNTNHFNGGPDRQRAAAADCAAMIANMEADAGADDGGAAPDLRPLCKMSPEELLGDPPRDDAAALLQLGTVSRALDEMRAYAARAAAHRASYERALRDELEREAR